MIIEPKQYHIVATRHELVALSKAFQELRLLQQKHPEERNGFDVNSQSTVAGIERDIVRTLSADAG